MIRPVLGAVWKALRRSQASISGTNIFFPSLAYFLREAGAFIWLIIGLVMLFPLSADPLRKIPPERLALWPLGRKERRILRWVTPWFTPVSWLVAALAVFGLRGQVSAGLWGALAALAAIGFTAPSLRVPQNPRVPRLVPAFPGAFGCLLRKDLRQLLTTLEFWTAALLSAAAAAYRIFGSNFPAEAGLMLSLLIVLIFASSTTCSFSLDGEAGMTRYRLLPLRGWQILAMKDAAVLLAIAILTLPLAPLSGIAAALVTVAIGHSYAIHERGGQARWRFSSGPSLWFGLVQLIALAFAGAGVHYSGAYSAGIAAAIYVLSTAWYGAQLCDN